MELKKIVAQNIIALRNAHHLTQYELGEKINYSDKAVSRWERGEAIPDAFVLLQLSQLFGVSVDYLLHEHSQGEQHPPEAPPIQPRINYKAITMISVIGVWTVALFAFIVLFLLGRVAWIVFPYALVVSLIVLIVLNSLWGNRRHNLYMISALMWSVLAAIYLTFLTHNCWMLFLLGIPAQAIIFLCFHIRLPRRGA
nr:helix-turn-helix transcriptional regulator [bacterium]